MSDEHKYISRTLREWISKIKRIPKHGGVFKLKKSSCSVIAFKIFNITLIKLCGIMISKSKQKIKQNARSQNRFAIKELYFI